MTSIHYFMFRRFRIKEQFSRLSREEFESGNPDEQNTEAVGPHMFCPETGEFSILKSSGRHSLLPYSWSEKESPFSDRLTTIFPSEPERNTKAEVFNLVVVKLAVRIKPIVPFDHQAQAALARGRLEGLG